MDHLVHEWITWYNGGRPHQALANFFGRRIGLSKLNNWLDVDEALQDDIDTQLALHSSHHALHLFPAPHNVLPGAAYVARPLPAHAERVADLFGQFQKVSLRHSFVAASPTKTRTL